LDRRKPFASFSIGVQQKESTMSGRKRFRHSMAAVALVLLISSMSAAAAPAIKSTSDVYWFFGTPNEGEQIADASSTLLRNSNGLAMTFKTSELPPKSVQTIWWVVFNYPENCIVPYECSPMDLFDEDSVANVVPSVMYAAGNVVGGNGRANFGGHLSVGDTSGCIRDGVPVDLEDASDLFFPCNPLENPLAVEVHLAVHDHGPLVPGLMKEMLTTYEGGCANMGHPDDEVLGPNQCATIQASVHPAP
jgi:hypothetical protein